MEISGESWHKEFAGAQAGQMTLRNEGLEVISVPINSQGWDTSTGWPLMGFLNH